MTEPKKRPRTAAQIAAEKKYAETKRKTIAVALFRATDADILDKLDQVARSGGSVQAYIRSCIRADIANEK